MKGIKWIQKRERERDGVEAGARNRGERRTPPVCEKSRRENFYEREKRKVEGKNARELESRRGRKDEDGNDAERGPSETARVQCRSTMKRGRWERTGKERGGTCGGSKVAEAKEPLWRRN